MSTSYRPLGNIPFNELRKSPPGQLSEAPSPDATESSFCITDGKYFMWCYGYENNTSFERYGRNNPENILEILSEAYGVEIISEHDEGFFEEEEE